MEGFPEKYQSRGQYSARACEGTVLTQGIGISWEGPTSWLVLFISLSVNLAAFLCFFLHFKIHSVIYNTMFK